MKSNQAFRQAVLTIGLPILALGSSFLYWFKPNSGEEWSVYLTFLLFLFVLLLPLIYRNYRRGPQPASAKTQLLSGILLLIAGMGYAADAFFMPDNKSHVAAKFLVAFCWFTGGVIELLQARKRVALTTSASHKTD